MKVMTTSCNGIETNSHSDATLRPNTDTTTERVACIDSTQQGIYSEIPTDIELKKPVFVAC